MSNPSFIAKRTWFAIAPDGHEFNLVIRLGQPYEASDVSWACPVAVEGLHNKLQDIQGIDSLQAIELAMRLAANLISGFVEDGGKLFWERGGEPVSLAESLPFAKPA